MKYFAKYLPIEGEIKEGDIVKHSLSSRLSKVLNAKDKFNIECEDFTCANISCNRVKLFLCSRDKVMDTENPPSSWKYNYTAIGEINPEAIWVKEGDEFEEDQIEIIFKHYESYLPADFEPTSEDYQIKIKGPCGHFH